jgi:O-antigen ligase
MDQVGIASWIEPAFLGVAAGIVGHRLWSGEGRRGTLPGLPFFLGAVACSLLLSVARFWPGWQEQLPSFLTLAWQSLANMDPMASEHTLRAGLLLMAGGFWLGLVGRSLSGEADFRKAAGCWLAGSLVAGAYGTWAWAHGVDPQWPFTISLLEDKNSYGSYLVLTLFLAWALWRSCRSPLMRAFAGLSLAMSIWMLLLSGSKIAIVAALAGSMVMGGAWLRHRRHLPRARTVLAIVLLAILAGWGSRFVLPQRVSLTILQVVTPLYLAEYMSDQRVAVWSAASRSVAEHPVLGLGPGLMYRQLGSYYEEEDRGWRPVRENAHNQFLQIAAETGLVGLAAFIGLVGGALWIGFGGGGGGGALSPSRLMATGVLGYLGTGITGHPLLLSRQTILFFGALGLMVALSGRNPRRPSLPHRPSAGQPPARLSMARRWLRPRWVLPAAVLVALLVQPFQRPCAAMAVSGQGLTWDFAAGFYPREGTDESGWHWMKSSGELRICRDEQKVEILDTVLHLASFSEPRRLEVCSRGETVGVLDIPPHTTAVALPPLRLAPGVTSLILGPVPGPFNIHRTLGGGDRRTVSIQVFGSPSHDRRVAP